VFVSDKYFSGMNRKWHCLLESLQPVQVKPLATIMPESKSRGHLSENLLQDAGQRASVRISISKVSDLSKVCVSFHCVYTAYNPTRCIDFPVLVSGDRSLTLCFKF
jgi:hypothetical protein